MILGCLKILCPRGLTKAKLYKRCSRVALTKLLLIQSLFKWTSSIPVMLIGFSLSYDPDIFWTNPSNSPIRSQMGLSDV